MQLLDRVRRTIRQHRLATPSTRVVAALSGGPDSIALLHILRALSEAGELQLVAAAHLNHRLRSAADNDERFGERVARSLDLPFVVERVDVRQIASRERRSLEDAAHRARYAFFRRAVKQLGADVVALGHTKDDQAETVLLRLLRGAGTRGLAGMYPKNDLVVRPLIDCRRPDVLDWVRQQNLAFVRDETNDDPTIPRNRIRAELLPLLEQRFNPNVVDILAAEAALSRAEHEFLDSLTSDWVGMHVRELGGVWRIDRTALTALPLALRRRVLFRALTRISGDRGVGFDDVERALEVVSGELAGFDAPGQRVERIDADVVLRSDAPGRKARRVDKESSSFSYALTVPGTVALPEIDAIVSAELSETGISAEMSNRGHLALVRADLVGSELAVRNRRPGDRLKPSEAGHRKLQDLLVDRKVPRTERDRIPVVVDSNGHIVWVVGHAVESGFRVTDPAQPMVVLRFKVVGGSF